MLFPPDEMLRRINYEDLMHVGRFTTISTKGLERKELLRQISEYGDEYLMFLKGVYRNWGYSLSNDVTQLHGQLFCDGIHNALYHGCIENNSPIISHGCYTTLQGIVSGFQDLGGYFLGKNIKEIFEAKDLDRLKELQYTSLGLQHILHFSDEIFVDTDNQVLYCLQMFNEKTGFFPVPIE